MATSGSINFTQTCNEVILDALQLIGAYGIGFTVSAEDMTFARSMLNKMVKAWATRGLHLFTKEEGVLYLTPGVNEYIIGSTAKATLASDEVTTSLNGALAASATSVTVDSTTSMTVADVIGIVLTDKTIHWTTIATIPSSTTLTLTTGVTGAAADNNLVFTYTTAMPRILRVLNARRRTGIGDTLTDIAISTIAYQEYQQLPTKSTQTVPTQCVYKPGSSYGSMYIWGASSTGEERIMFTYERVIEDLDSTSDNFDFPPEWLETLTYQLAVRLARPFGKPSAMNDLLPLAESMLNNLLDWDSEVASIDFCPVTRGY
jgi:hypothetical protein